MRILLKDVFGFAKHHKKATVGWGYILSLKKIDDDVVFSRNADKLNGKNWNKEF